MVHFHTNYYKSVCEDSSLITTKRDNKHEFRSATVFFNRLKDRKVKVKVKIYLCLTFTSEDVLGKWRYSSTHS